MTLQTLIRKLKDADALHTAEVWIQIGNDSYLAEDIRVDAEGDLIIKCGTTPY